MAHQKGPRLVHASIPGLHPVKLAIDGEVGERRSHLLPASWMRVLIAQISLSFRGSFWPTSLPLFQGFVTFDLMESVLMEPSYCHLFAGDLSAGYVP
jgi:hypothetical protein